MTTEHPLNHLRVLLVSAFDPWAVGNGSSLRAGRWCAALDGAAAFDAVVVPVVHTDQASPYYRVPLPDDDESVANLALLTAPRWRDWLVRASPLPRSAATAPAWLGRGLLARLPWRPDVVVAFKMAVAPVAADLAMECGVPLLVDLDDDEAALGAALGAREADALERLLRGVGELAAVVTVASPSDVAAVAARVAAPVMLVPNTVDLPPPLPAPRPATAMYVANFDYGPNRASAHWLVGEVLAHLVGVDELAVIGHRSHELALVAPATAHGLVPDLRAFYTRAAVALCPVLTGSGTSLKVIEALAHGRAVVTTTVGARGLELRDGVHAVVTDDPLRFAAAVSHLATDVDAALALGARGRALVEERYSAAAGSSAMRAAVAAALSSP